MPGEALPFPTGVAGGAVGGIFGSAVSILGSAIRGGPGFSNSTFLRKFVGQFAQTLAQSRANTGGGSPDVRPPPPPAQASTPPFIPSLPLPDVPPLGAILGGLPWEAVLGPIIAGALFWPTSTASDDVIYTAAGPVAVPGGRRRRGRRPRAVRPARPGRRPRAVPRPIPGRGGPVTISRPRAPAQARVIDRPAPPPPLVPKSPYWTQERIEQWERDTYGEPGTMGDNPLPKPSPSTGSQSNAPTSSTSSSPAVPAPYPASIPAPRPTTGPYTGTLPPPPWVGQLNKALKVLGDLAKLVPPASPKHKRGRVTVVQPQPYPVALPQPLTMLQTAAVPYAATQARTRDCSCAKTKSRRKKTCRNPVTKRKRETRGGHKFVTITKRLDCERGKAA